MTDGLAAVEAACAEALDGGTHSADVILNILSRHAAPEPIGSVVTPAHLTLEMPPRADCARYDGLRPPPILPSAAQGELVLMEAFNGAV
jgi:hypothetical protein